MQTRTSRKRLLSLLAEAFKFSVDAGKHSEQFARMSMSVDQKYPKMHSINSRSRSSIFCDVEEALADSSK
jgi:hypothetical protein